MNHSHHKALSDGVTAAAVLMRKSRERVETKIETLPQEVRLLIEQMRATCSDHERRLAQLERVNQALVAEASAKVRGAA